ncbi:MAG: thioesterase family protein, partial [Jatrophihabitantaceae bacterium]
EQVAAQSTGRQDLNALRLAAEFVRPVPVGEVHVTARVVRAARSGALVEAVLSADGRCCLQARIWLIRDEDTTAICPTTPLLTVAPSDAPGLGASFPYADSIEWRSLAGAIDVVGPGVFWTRPRRLLLPDSAMSALQRAVLVGDSASGISSELDWANWSFLNVDLDVHLARPVVGEWLLMDAVTQLGPNGSALTRSSLSDVNGSVGCTAQTLVLSPRR